MTENSEILNVPAVAVEEKKVKKTLTGVKKVAAKPNHPPTAEMVDSAIKTLKERGGSSLLAIKKYLARNYKVDADKLAPFIKKYLKGSVESGHLIQTKGKGASGSFKLSAAASKPKKEMKQKDKKAKIEKKVKKVVRKKLAAAVGDKKKKTVTVTPKKTVDKKKSEKLAAKVIKKTDVLAVKTKTVKQKSTKPSKTDSKKPKTPKPKKATSPKKVAAKKIVKK